MQLIAINELDNYESFMTSQLFASGKRMGLQQDRDYSEKYKVVDARELKWTPDFIFFHEKEKHSTETTYYRDNASGSIVCIYCWNITISQLLDLASFPFDRQLLKIHFIVLGVAKILPYTPEPPRPTSGRQLFPN